MIISIIVFLLVLSVLVVVHELGHFIVAKKFGVWVEEFGFGLPPKVLGKKIGDTIWSLNALPFGGFVKLHGESSENEVSVASKAFINKPKKVRAGIIVAGVLMNLLLAIIAFAIVYSFSGIPRETNNVKVVDIVAGSPAQVAGLVVGDIVRKVDNLSITKTEDFIKVIEDKKGKRTILEVQRDSETMKLTVIPRENPPHGEGPLGVTITTTDVYYPPYWQRPFVGVYYGVGDALYWGKLTVLGFVKVFTDLAGGQTPKDLAGPVGIFAITTEAAKFGILSLINFVGILSINLAILNIVPFPALDGGRLLFIGIEAIIGKKVSPNFESKVHIIGMIILLTLLLAITAHDIQRLVAAGGISGFINTVLK